MAKCRIVGKLTIPCPLRFLAVYKQVHHFGGTEIENPGSRCCCFTVNGTARCSPPPKQGVLAHTGWPNKLVTSELSLNRIENSSIGQYLSVKEAPEYYQVVLHILCVT